jgi:peptidoglycan/LPS O-acetylase OafA/YrhL
MTAAGEGAPAPVRRIDYPALDGLRCYAALLVFMVHLFGAILTEYFRVPADQISVQSPVSGIATMTFLADGHHGVDVFFLMSGFLMARIAAPGMNWFGFVKRRWLRIYPAFLASLLLSTAMLVGLYGWPFQLRDFLLNLVFFNSLPDHGILPYNHVTWSLGYEFAFYLMVPLLAMWRAPWMRATAAALLMVAASTLLSGPPIRMAGLFAGFLLGCASDAALRNVATRVPVLVAVAAYCALVWAKALVPLHFLMFNRLLLPVAALLIVCIVFGDNVFTRFFSSRPMRALGRWSYSIYLLHPMAIALVIYQLLPATGQQQRPFIAVPLVCLAAAGLTVAAAALWYRLFEAPYFRTRGRGRVVPAAPPVPDGNQVPAR